MTALDLRDPRYNLREVAKQWLLLEEHLSDPEKFCRDCIVKHAALAEAYAGEAFQLDSEKRYTALISDALMSCRRIHEALRNEAPEVASIVRQARKSLLPLVY